MVLSHKGGGSLCVKDVFAKKFFGAGEIPLAACSHRFLGSILVKAGTPDAIERCAGELVCRQVADILKLPARILIAAIIDLGLRNSGVRQFPRGRGPTIKKLA
jgi:hypothetical protein